MNMEYGFFTGSQNTCSSRGQFHKRKLLESSILIPWGFISSVVHFPEAEGFDFPNPFETKIGFK